jgi:hypothetical protein
MEKFLSLYDYLGKAAGPELGKQVHSAAVAVGIPTERKYVSNLSYKGWVQMYPENWLIGYFSTGQSPYNERKEFSI